MNNSVRADVFSTIRSWPIPDSLVRGLQWEAITTNTYTVVVQAAEYVQLRLQSLKDESAVALKVADETNQEQMMYLIGSVTHMRLLYKEHMLRQMAKDANDEAQTWRERLQYLNRMEGFLRTGDGNYMLMVERDDGFTEADNPAPPVEPNLSSEHELNEQLQGWIDNVPNMTKPAATVLNDRKGITPAEPLWWEDFFDK